MTDQEKYLYRLGLGVGATIAEAMMEGIRSSASDQPLSAVDALSALAKILRSEADRLQKLSG